MSELQSKIDRAIRLLQSIKADEIELCYYGGKDSDVILELAKMAGISYRAIYKMTTIDPPGTIKHCRENGVEIHKPVVSFFELIEKKGFPTMRARFCCDKLKEYKILDHAILGIRRCESVKRMVRYKEPVICRFYGSKKNHANQILPILDWKDKDIMGFIQLRDITCHPLYYVDGVFDVNKRLGCIGCPLKYDKGVSDFIQHPQLVKTWIKQGEKWWNKPRDKDIESKKNFKDVYELFTHNIFFKSYEDFRLARSGMFGQIDCKTFLENYFNIKF